MAGPAIDRVFERRLAALINCRERGVLGGGLRGLERESLRVTPEGRVSASAHPRALGAALTHPNITTDFSEALIELVTPTFTSNALMQRYLLELHGFVHRHLDDEVLWAASMPCQMGGDADVPLADYGRSHLGQFKQVYRRGLRNRYGGMMQAIAGVHFNYSFPREFWPVYAELTASKEAGRDFISTRYFELLRAFRRHGWLVTFLFGASPALCRSFLHNWKHTGLEALDGASVGLPAATSLRMSDLGYRNDNQAGVAVSVNSLDHYQRDLLQATSTVHAPFEALGVKVGGEYRQLNANVLQIENEYYSAIRPKAVPRLGERTLSALGRSGVEYVEVRTLDLNPFEPTGVALHELHLMEAFMVLLLLRDSPPIEPSEQAWLDENHLAVARRGREPALKLVRDGRAQRLTDWARELIDALQGICELLDADDPARPYSAALRPLLDPAAWAERAPAARWLREMRERDMSFQELAMSYSSAHRSEALALALEPARRDQFEALAAESAEAQARLEAADRGSFDDYLLRYFAKPVTV